MMLHLFKTERGALLLTLAVAYPWRIGKGGVTEFAADVQAKATKTAPWAQWQGPRPAAHDYRRAVFQGRPTPLAYLGVDHQVITT